MISMYAEYSGRTLYVALSSDTIDGAKNGDKLYEMDTGKRYVYNESNDAWDEQPEEGGGSGGDYVASGWLDKTKPTNGAVLTYDGTTAPPTIAKRTGTFSIVMPNCTTLSSDQQFANSCSGLTGVTAPNLTTIQPTYVFAYTTSWTGAAFFPKATISGNAFKGSRVSVAVFNSIANANQSAFSDNPNLRAVDKIGSSSINGVSNFSNCTNLDVVVLRSTTVVALGNTNNFTGTPFASLKRGGTLYVPSALIDSYKAATNWSTILAYGNGKQNKILPIEGSIYETQYADGTPIQ